MIINCVCIYTHVHTHAHEVEIYIYLNLPTSYRYKVSLHKSISLYKFLYMYNLTVLLQQFWRTNWGNEIGNPETDLSTVQCSVMLHSVLSFSLLLFYFYYYLLLVYFIVTYRNITFRHRKAHIRILYRIKFMTQINCCYIK